jgi:hypothetical protein
LRAAAAVLALHLNLGGDAVLHGFDVRDDADGFAGGPEVLQNAHGHFQGAGV